MVHSSSKKLHLEVNYKVLFKALKDLKYISDMKYLKVQTQAYVTYYTTHSNTHSLEASIAKLCTRLHYASMFQQRCPDITRGGPSGAEAAIHARPILLPMQK